MSRISLPDQIHDPDWSEVRTQAELLLENSVTREDDDTESEREQIYLLAESVLEALYGPHVSEFVRKLRMEYGIE